MIRPSLCEYTANHKLSSLAVLLHFHCSLAIHCSHRSAPLPLLSHNPLLSPSTLLYQHQPPTHRLIAALKITRQGPNDTNTTACLNQLGKLYQMQRRNGAAE